MMALMLVALAVTGAGTLTLLRSYLEGQVDDKLKAAVESAEQERSFSQIATPNTSVPTDYSVVVYYPGAAGRVLSDTRDPRPDIDSITVDEARQRGFQPYQVRGTDNENWRVVAVSIVDSNQQRAVVVIGLPLSTVDQVLGHATLVVVGVGLLTLILAFFIASWTVTRSFRPLARVEKTAAAIAAGDLSRRVAVENPDTEVGRLGRSLNAMLAHIEAAFAARMASEDRMRRFAADASHELRTPLVTIRGYSELYRHGALESPEEIANAMGRIESEAKRMGSMVEDLLLLARLDEQRPLQQKPVDLQLLAHDAVVDTQASDPTRVIALTGLNGGRAQPAPVLGDEAKLRQVVGNLVGNALRYTPEGTPIELAVGMRSGKDDSLQAVLEVRDHGPGIPDSEAPKVFERFYRADTSRTRDTGGSGLGLAIVAAIVGSHGGSVRVDTTAGGGATLIVSLPARNDAREEHRAGSGSQRLDRKPDDGAGDGASGSPDDGRTDDGGTDGGRTDGGRGGNGSQAGLSTYRS
ncbi:cell wall metabolism sensor histidine kinase WalK [Arthrobacter sp. ISL-5]|uniref:sensor histidine kinase n=1 Tax=Arthrobacter sp. ISL-5 TaxID=2819111 RepID=UPI002035D1BE|nr:HAMP domain-containing sensor histidine kinase [Arthrobacter sp. ISL-5]